MQGLQEGGTERVVGAWVQGGGGSGACFFAKGLLLLLFCLLVLRLLYKSKRMREGRTHAAQQTPHASPMPPCPSATYALLGSVDGIAAAPAEVEGADGGEAGCAEGGGERC